MSTGQVTNKAVTWPVDGFETKLHVRNMGFFYYQEYYRGLSVLPLPPEPPYHSAYPALVRSLCSRIGIRIHTHMHARETRARTRVRIRIRSCYYILFVVVVVVESVEMLNSAIFLHIIVRKAYKRRLKTLLKDC